MDEPLVKPASTSTEIDVGRCGYCGSPLVEGLYFCANCATPYRRPETVLTPMKLHPLTAGELIVRKAPRVAPVFWTYFSIVLGAAIVSHLLFRGDLAPQLVIQYLALSVTTCVLGAMYWSSLKVQLTRLGLLSPWMALGVGIMGVMLVGNYFYHEALVELGAPRRSLIAELRDIGLSPAGLVTVVCVLPAVFEEIAFRGLLQHWLQVAVRPLLAIALASGLFTIMHFSILSAPYLFAVGALLGWTKWKTGSLYPPMVLHFLHNFGVIAFIDGGL